tara:strand:- start:338 stop:625 length:288 start_codon:yes stop_codon:yes gene_type:complete
MTLRELHEIISGSVEKWGDNAVVILDADKILDADQNTIEIRGLLNNKYCSFLVINKTDQEVLEGTIENTELDQNELNEIHRAYHDEELRSTYNTV